LAIVQQVWNEETLNLPPQRCGNLCASASVCWCSEWARRSQIGLPNGVTGRTLVSETQQLYLTLSLARAGFSRDSNQDTFFTVHLTATYTLLKPIFSDNATKILAW